MAANHQEEYAKRVREQMQDAGDVVYAPIAEAEAGEGVSWRVTEAGVVVSLDGSEPPAIALEKAKQIEAELKPQLKTVLSEAELKWVKERQEQEEADAIQHAAELADRFRREFFARVSACSRNLSL